MALHVQVCGDPTVDWMGTSNQREPGLGQFFWDPGRTVGDVGLSVQPGGAALITQLLAAMLPEGTDLQGVELPPALLEHPIDAPVARSWTMWRAFGRSDQKTAFRISTWSSTEPGAFAYATQKHVGPCDLLVIEDTGLGFRYQPRNWPEVLAARGGPATPEVLLKLARFSNGTGQPVLERLRRNGLASRTTVLVALSDMRACPVRVGTSLSWESLLEEIVAGVFSPACPFVDADTGQLPFARVVVTAGVSGAVVVDNHSNALIFDRTGQEGDLEDRFAGGMMGYNTCFVGALAAAWAEQQDATDWAAATRDGVGLARMLHLGGYIAEPRPPAKGRPRAPSAGAKAAEPSEALRLTFPLAKIATAFQERRAGAAPRDDDEKLVWDLGLFRDATRLANRRKPWTILEQVVRHTCGGSPAPGTRDWASVRRCACRVVVEGPEGPLADVPMESVGDWQSADRHEIEGVRSVHNAMRTYLNAGKFDKPMAVAVFGPPGAGKSFAIKQIAVGLGIGEDEQLTYNLSQFENPTQLAQAFHEIRDLQLKGSKPLVFWDEFDSPRGDSPLGWLRYFLAPIQDGEFMDAGVTHPTGGGIYVFAGGTRHRFADFSGQMRPGDAEAKKPDFVSRLKAFIDVKGPNGDPNIVEDDLVLIRRAFLLHSFLKRFAPGLEREGCFQIGPGVLNAFLRTTLYRHGARSMESLVRMSELKGRGRYEPSSLPPDHLLAMHVIADEFVELLESADREMLRVGITGHIGLDPAKMAALEAGVQHAVAQIEQAFPQRVLTVFSPLAVGADRVVARELLARPGSRLIAVLPVPEDDYVNDFGATPHHHEDYDSAELIQEFRYLMAHRALASITMSPSTTRDEAYQKVGFYVAEHADVLVAVWDGQEAQGRGGTAEVVDQAVKLGRPVCHVWAGNYKRNEQKRTDVGEQHGQIRRINFPGQAPGKWQDV